MSARSRRLETKMPFQTPKNNVPRDELMSKGTGLNGNYWASLVTPPTSHKCRPVRTPRAPARFQQHIQGVWKSYGNMIPRKLFKEFEEAAKESVNDEKDVAVSSKSALIAESQLNLQPTGMLCPTLIDAPKFSKTSYDASNLTTLSESSKCTISDSETHPLVARNSGSTTPSPKFAPGFRLPDTSSSFVSLTPLDPSERTADFSTRSTSPTCYTIKIELATTTEMALTPSTPCSTLSTSTCSSISVLSGTGRPLSSFAYIPDFAIAAACPESTIKASEHVDVLKRFTDLKWKRYSDAADGVQISKSLAPPHHLINVLRICTSTTLAKSSQDNTLIFIIHEGCLEIKIGTNSKFTVRKGDAFFVPSQTSYTINNEGVDVAEMFVTQYSLNPEDEQREIIAPKN